MISFVAYTLCFINPFFCASFMPPSSFLSTTTIRNDSNVRVSEVLLEEINQEERGAFRSSVVTMTLRSKHVNNKVFKLNAQQNNSNENDNENKNENLATTAMKENEKILKSSNQIPLLLANSKCIPNQMSPTSLAYIGDVVYEMCIRCRYVWPTRRTSDLQNVVVAKVRAETQSIIFVKVQSSFPLTKEEQTIISRGRNAGSPKKKSRGPKRLYGTNNNTNNTNINGNEQQSSASGLVGNQGPAAYQDSTALEALIGYLYLSDGDRCNELLEFICSVIDEMDEMGG